MKNMKKAPLLLWLIVLLVGLATAVPALAHGDEEGEEEGSGVVEDGDEEDDHDNDDDPVDGNDYSSDANLLSGLMPLWAGLIGSVLITGGIGAGAKPRPTNLLLLGLALIGITGGLHLVGGLIWGDWLLILNGIGFIMLGLAWVLPFSFIPRQKRLVPLVLVGYTLITIIGYFVTHDHFDTLGIASKVVEFALLGVLAVALVQERNGA